MLSRNIFIFIGFIVVFLSMTSPIQSQIIYGQQTSGDLQIIYSHWTLKSERGTIKIGQFMSPIGGFIPLGENFEASFYVAGSSNKLNLPQKEMNLSGLSDCHLQINHSFLNDAFLLSGGVNLPTGKKNLDLAEEWLVMEYLSQDYLAFPMSRLGEGFGCNILAGVAFSTGAMQCGAGAMYQYTGTYEPYKDAGEYNPGDVYSANVGADLKTGYMTWSADIIYTGYTTDKLEDKKSFKQSPQVDMRLGGIYGNRAFSTSAELRYLIRGRNTRYSETETIVEQLKIYGNEFMAGGNIAWSFAGGWSLAPSAEMRLIAANEEDVGKSNIYGFGGELGRKLGNSASLNLGFKYLTGDADGGKIDLTGYQISAAFRTGL
jgi:hypothetical protein